MRGTGGASNGSVRTGFLVLCALGWSACAARPTPATTLLSQTPPSVNAPPYATVLGEVLHPGRIELQRPRPLREVLRVAGGFTSLACGQVIVRRGFFGHSVAVGLSVRALREGAGAENNVLVQRGDMLYISQCD